MRIFIDTSFFIALTMKRDQWHVRARGAMPSEMSLVTSSLVVNETISLLQARGYFSDALVFLREVRGNEHLEMLYVDPALQSQAWDEFSRWGAMGANAVDCVSFSLMKNYGIRRALTFDQHFRLAGFEVGP